MTVIVYLCLNVEEIRDNPFEATNICRLWDGPLIPVGTSYHLPTEYGQVAEVSVEQPYTVHSFADKREDEFVINLELLQSDINNLDARSEVRHEFWESLQAKGWVAEKDINPEKKD